MIIYVESNFVLELALLQEQHLSCENILSICEVGNAKLLVPAFSLAEPYEALIRKHNQRSYLNNQLTTEFDQISRSEPYKNQIEGLKDDITTLLVKSIEEEKERLSQTRERILNLAEIIPLTSDVFRAAATCEKTLSFSPQDALVYASVIQHLKTSNSGNKCFLNKNSKDFDQAEIVDELKKYCCKMLFSFNSGYNYIQHQLRSN
jgi:predicted nucleic acid-binding protein